MKTIKLFTSIAIVAAILTSGCKKDEPVTKNPIVIPLQTTVQKSVVLSDITSFVVLSGAAISSTGETVITGDLGMGPGTALEGFPPGIINGTQHINDAIANQAKMDLIDMYTDIKGRTCADIVTLSGNIGGLTLTPGLYMSTSSLAVSSGDLTFDAKGNTDAIFILQMASSLTTTIDRKVLLTNGALASNIFWQVGSSATFGTNSVFKGTVLVMESITFNPGATLDGRALTRTGAVVMASNIITLK